MDLEPIGERIVDADPAGSADQLGALSELLDATRRDDCMEIRDDGVARYVDDDDALVCGGEDEIVPAGSPDAHPRARRDPIRGRRQCSMLGVDDPPAAAGERGTRAADRHQIDDPLRAGVSPRRPGV
jgi:hypothetical protein